MPSAASPSAPNVFYLTMVLRLDFETFFKTSFRLWQNKYLNLDCFQVCAACHKAAESGSAPRPRSPPTALERRLERLASVPQQPITVYSKESEKMTRLKRGLSQEDKGIAERLQRLQRYAS